MHRAIVVTDNLVVVNNFDNVSYYVMYVLALIFYKWKICIFYNPNMKDCLLIYIVSNIDRLEYHNDTDLL